VLRALPGLKTLDKVSVQPEEVQDALRRGRDLVHPEVMGVGQDEYWEQPASRDCSPPRDYQRVEVRGGEGKGGEGRETGCSEQ
jgi:hypothetical protein